LIINEILAAFPNDGLITEEEDALWEQTGWESTEQALLHAARMRTRDVDKDVVLGAVTRARDSGIRSGRVWVVDPIDGTKGLMSGGQYAIAIALLINARVVVGTVYCPSLVTDLPGSGEQGSCFLAIAGRGAYERDWVNMAWQAMSVDTVSDPREAVLGESRDPRHTPHEEHRMVARRAGIVRPAVRIDSQCKHCLVSRGDVSVYLRFPKPKGHHEKIWDHAAGVCLVQEAGGRVSDRLGREIDFTAGVRLSNNDGIIASNGLLHDTLLSASSR
jgi:3'(2'), 5'-bisphosphate nucleotidase